MVDIRTFELEQRVVCSTDAGILLGTVKATPPKPTGYYTIRMDNGREVALTWGNMQPDTGRKFLAAPKSANQIIRELGELTDEDMKWCWQGLNHMVTEHSHEIGEMSKAQQTLATVILSPDKEISKAIMMIVNEAIGLGKERTLNKMARLMDPDGMAMPVTPAPWEDDEPSNEGQGTPHHGT